MEEAAQSFHTLSGDATLSTPWCVHQPETLQTPSSSGFYRGSVTQAWLIKPLVGGDCTQFPVPLPFLEVRGWDYKFQPTNQMVISRAASLYPEILLGPTKSHLISINSDRNEKGLLWNTQKKYFYHPYQSGNCKSFRSCVRTQGQRHNIYFFFFFF